MWQGASQGALRRLTDEFGTGFSRSNLEYMRRFYLTYQNRAGTKSQTLSGISEEIGMIALLSIPQTLFTKSELASNDSLFSLSWSHYVFLLGMNGQKRSFYEVEASQQGWTLRELKRQYNSGLFERLAPSMVDTN